MFGILLLVEKRFTLRKGQVLALYISLYTIGRFVFENMRSDFAHTILGLRINAWLSLGLFLFATVWFIWLGRHGRPYDARDTNASGRQLADAR